VNVSECDIIWGQFWKMQDGRKAAVKMEDMARIFIM
jgi:hypothetical protein